MKQVYGRGIAGTRIKCLSMCIRSCGQAEDVFLTIPLKEKCRGFLNLLGIKMHSWGPNVLLNSILKYFSPATWIIGRLLTWLSYGLFWIVRSIKGVSDLLKRTTGSWVNKSNKMNVAFRFPGSRSGRRRHYLKLLSSSLGRLSGAKSSFLTT